MPTKAYEAIVGTEYYDRPELAIAQAAALLARQAVMFSYSDILDINLYGGKGEQQIGVGLVFRIEFEDDHAESTFRYHMGKPDGAVESWEEVSIEA